METVITLQQLERAFGMPAKKWAGKCYGVACAASRLIARSRPICGHYLGKVCPTSMFATSALAGFVQHGWVLLKDGHVLDPTRWVFEGKKPYIYVGSAKDYDEGGNAHRTTMLGKPPEFDPDEKVVKIGTVMLASEPWCFVERVLRLDRITEEDYEPGTVNVGQLHWLANLDPHTMEGHARAIYKMLKKLNLVGFIPIDNRRAAEEGRV